jgi:hypothetical protein
VLRNGCMHPFKKDFYFFWISICVLLVQECRDSFRECMPLTLTKRDLEEPWPTDKWKTLGDSWQRFLLGDCNDANTGKKKKHKWKPTLRFNLSSFFSHSFRECEEEKPKWQSTMPPKVIVLNIHVHLKKLKSEPNPLEVKLIQIQHFQAVGE